MVRPTPSSFGPSPKCNKNPVSLFSYKIARFGSFDQPDRPNKCGSSSSVRPCCSVFEMRLNLLVRPFARLQPHSPGYICVWRDQVGLCSVSGSLSLRSFAHHSSTASFTGPSHTALPQSDSQPFQCLDTFNVSSDGHAPFHLKSIRKHDSSGRDWNWFDNLFFFFFVSLDFHIRILSHFSVEFYPFFFRPFN